MHFIKIVKGINARLNVDNQTFIIFPVGNPPAQLIRQLNMMVVALKELTMGFTLNYCHILEDTTEGMLASFCVLLDCDIS